MQRRETFGALGVGHAVRPQPLSVATRTGDEMNTVCEGVDPVRDEGTRPAAVNPRSSVRLESAGILACLRSGRHFLPPRTACCVPHASWMLPPIQSRRTRIGRAAGAAPVSRDEGDRKQRPVGQHDEKATCVSCSPIPSPPRATRGSCHNIHTRTCSRNAAYMSYPHGDATLFTLVHLFRVADPETGERRIVTPSSALPAKALQGALPSGVIADLDAGRLGFVLGFLHMEPNEQARDIGRRAIKRLRQQISAFASIHGLAVTQPELSDAPSTPLFRGHGGAGAACSRVPERRLCACGCGARITGRRDARFAGAACRQRAHRARARIDSLPL